jgi:hypothetical protein
MPVGMHPAGGPTSIEYMYPARDKDFAKHFVLLQDGSAVEGGEAVEKRWDKSLRHECQTLTSERRFSYLRHEFVACDHFTGSKKIWHPYARFSERHTVPLSKSILEVAEWNQKARAGGSQQTCSKDIRSQAWKEEEQVSGGKAYPIPIPFLI